MKKLLSLLVLSLALQACKDKTENVSEEKKISKQESAVREKPKPVVDSNKIVEIGDYNTYEKLPKLTFAEISESEFDSVQPENHFEKTKTEEKGNFIFVRTSVQTHKLKKYKDYGGKESWNGYALLGYYPTLKLFALTTNWTADNFGFGIFFLLDETTDFQYKIESFGDGSVQLPILSTNSKYLVYYDNPAYDGKTCDIGVLKIGDKSSPKNYLKEFASFHSDDFEIEEIKWKTDDCFYIKTSQEDKTKFKYFQTKFK